MSTPRILPGLTQDTRPFWTGGREGRLLIHRCNSCGFWLHPPGPVCARCLSREVAPTPASGRAAVASFTVNHQPWSRGMAVPFVFAAVELAEQPALHLLTNIVGCPPDSVRIGMRVRVTFEQHGDVWLPVFEPERQSQ
jgi:uncharacterized OB-fold protein